MSNYIRLGIAHLITFNIVALFIPIICVIYLLITGNKLSTPLIILTIFVGVITIFNLIYLFCIWGGLKK